MTLKQILVDLDKLPEEGAKKLVLDIHERVTRGTPVDTGWAANNWIPSTGVPIEKTAGTPESLDKGTVNRGVLQILKWTFRKGAAFITNNVPYIGRLNAGSSKQAPALFVESAVNGAVAKANRTKLK